MRNLRNEDLSQVIYASEKDTGPWVAVDRYGRRLVVASLSSDTLSNGVGWPEGAPAEGSATIVDSASTLVLSSNQNRIGGFIFNDSSTEVRLSTTGAASSTSPIMLGRYASFPLAQNGYIIKREIQAFQASGGTIRLRYVEVESV